MKTIAIASQKGGVGKTTTAWALSHFLGMQGYRVLAVDMDSQMNFSKLSGEIKVNGSTIFNALMHSEETPKAIEKRENYDYLMGSEFIVNIEREIIGTPGQEYYLKESLEEVKDNYDWCIIDTPPALSIITINAMAAADLVLIPVQADTLSLAGLDALYNSFASVRKYVNPKLKIAGILLTRYNPRTVLSRDMTEIFAQRAEEMETKLFTSTIRESVVIQESQTCKDSPFHYKPKNGAVKDYERFSKEFLNEIKENE